MVLSWPRKAMTPAMDYIRRHGRPIIWPDRHSMGLGNLLYLWLHADKLRFLGQDAHVLRTDWMADWLPELPSMGELTIARNQVKLTDRRVLGSPQDFERDLTPKLLNDFVTDRLLSAPSLRPDELATLVGTDEVVINVRRGDYYSNPKVRGIYGFDVDAYLRVAVELAAKQAPITGFWLVSDGMQWCRARLGWLSKYAPVRYADEYAPHRLRDFRLLAGANRLILTNSTFSYWGGYVSNVLHRNEARTIAPWFHARTIEWGRAYQLNPAWQIVADIPGGWDS